MKPLEDLAISSAPGVSVTTRSIGHPFTQRNATSEDLQPERCGFAAHSIESPEVAGRWGTLKIALPGNGTKLGSDQSPLCDSVKSFKLQTHWFIAAFCARGLVLILSKSPQLYALLWWGHLPFQVVLFGSFECEDNVSKWQKKRIGSFFFGWLPGNLSRNDGS